MSSKIIKRGGCRLCDSANLEMVLRLAPTPPANAFVPDGRLTELQEKFPLDVYFCNDCYHVQLLDVVDAEVLFRDYVYVSGTSPVFVKHFENYADDLCARKNGQSEGLVLDIGSNDGSLLKFFQRKGFNVLGIDPAVNIALGATSDGVETWPVFFTPQTVQKILAEKGQADIITANNVFAHIDDLAGVTRGIDALLKPDGIFSFEVSYLADVLEKTLFDTIYHEHLSYHSIKPLIGFFTRFGLELFSAKRVDTHGGSIRCYVRKSTSRNTVANDLQELLDYESGLELYNADTFKQYAQKVDKVKNELTALLHKIKSESGSIAAYGAPAKATTLMHHFNIDNKIIDFVVDDSPLKAGLYTPGFHIPVVSSQAIYEKKPDYLVMLAWNFADSIINNHRAYIEAGGRFIIPLPEIRVVGA